MVIWKHSCAGTTGDEDYCVYGWGSRGDWEEFRRYYKQPLLIKETAWLLLSSRPVRSSFFKLQCGNATDWRSGGSCLSVNAKESNVMLGGLTQIDWDGAGTNICPNAVLCKSISSPDIMNLQCQLSSVASYHGSVMSAVTIRCQNHTTWNRIHNIIKVWLSSEINGKPMN